MWREEGKRKQEILLASLAGVCYVSTVMKVTQEFGWSRIKQNISDEDYNLPVWENINGTFLKGDIFTLGRSMSPQFGMFKINTQWPLNENNKSFDFVYQFFLTKAIFFRHNLSLHNKNKEICEENTVLMHLK